MCVLTYCVTDYRTCYSSIIHCMHLRASACKGTLWTMKETYKNIRIYAGSWKRLKVLAARKGVTVINLIDELVKNASKHVVESVRIDVPVNKEECAEHPDCVVCTLEDGLVVHAKRVVSVEVSN